MGRVATMPAAPICNSIMFCWPCQISLTRRVFCTSDTAWPRSWAADMSNGGPPTESFRSATPTWSWSGSSTTTGHGPTISGVGSRALGQGLVQPLGWAVRTRSIDDVAQRLDLVVSSGSRTAPDGRELRWWLAGVERASAESSHPFFIQWAGETPHPSQMPVTHPAGTVVVDHVEVGGDSTRLVSWLGDNRLPVVISSGPSTLERIVLHSSTREIVLAALQQEYKTADRQPNDEH